MSQFHPIEDWGADRFFESDRRAHSKATPPSAHTTSFYSSSPMPSNRSTGSLPIVIPIDHPAPPTQGQNPQPLQVCFHTSGPMMNPLATPSPQSKAGRIESILARLIPYESALLQWVADSPHNARLFVTEPLRALELANLGLPESLSIEIHTVSAWLAQDPNP
jgi:hypothetical protein